MVLLVLYPVRLLCQVVDVVGVAVRSDPKDTVTRGSGPPGGEGVAGQLALIAVMEIVE